MHVDKGQHCVTVGPGIGGIKYPNMRVFAFFSELLQWISFIFCMAIEANTVQLLAAVLLRGFTSGLLVWLCKDQYSSWTEISISFVEVSYCLILLMLSTVEVLCNEACLYVSQSVCHCSYNSRNAQRIFFAKRWCIVF